MIYDERDDVSLEASDRYSTPPWLIARCAGALGGIDCDPFYDDTSTLRAEHTIDARAGGNAYVDEWRGRRALVNGAYGGRLPQLTAKRVAEYFLLGGTAISICPAAVGSAYWRQHVWPYASAVAFLGRVAFPAGVDVYDKRGQLVCPAGVARGGNRTEIAAVYLGPDVLRFRRWFDVVGHVEPISSRPRVGFDLAELGC